MTTLFSVLPGAGDTAREDLPLRRVAVLREHGVLHDEAVLAHRGQPQETQTRDEQDSAETRPGDGEAHQAAAEAQEKQGPSPVF